MVLGAEAEFSASSLRGSCPALDGIETLATGVNISEPSPASLASQLVDY